MPTPTHRKPPIPSSLSAPTSLPQNLINPISPTRTHLHASLSLLHLLHTRHKNQHRRALWFRAFSHFRREVGKFCGEIGIFLLPHAGGVLGKRKRGADDGGIGVREGKEKDRESYKHAARRLAYWVEKGLIPRWYTAITSLSATPSFTPLSLTLLALLARTLQETSALPRFTAYYMALRDRESAELEREEDERIRREEKEMVEVLERFAKERERDEEEQDGKGDEGVKIERVPIATPDAGVPLQPPQSQPRAKPPSTAIASPAELSQTRPLKNPKRTKKSKNAIDALFAGL